MPRNVWKYRVDVSDVFHNDEISFEQRRDAVVKRMRRSLWYKRSEEYSVLRALVEELSDAENSGDFNSVWDEIYDEADIDRCWITTS